MKVSLFSSPPASGFVAGMGWVLLAVLLAPVAGAQAAPGPLPQTGAQDGSAPPPRAAAPEAPRSKMLAGTWRLNTDDSDDPFQKMQQARSSSGNGGAGGRRGGGMGGGWPGAGGIGGRGGYGSRGQEGGGDSDSDSQKMHIFLQPARELTISQQEPEIDVVDDDARKVRLFTDGRKVEKSKDANNSDLDARWEEYRLVAEGKDPRGNTYQRCYEVLEGKEQLRETLTLQVGRNKTEVSIRLVYDLLRPPPTPAPQTR